MLGYKDFYDYKEDYLNNFPLEEETDFAEIIQQLSELDEILPDIVLDVYAGRRITLKDPVIWGRRVQSRTRVILKLYENMFESYGIDYSKLYYVDETVEQTETRIGSEKVKDEGEKVTLDEYGNITTTDTNTNTLSDNSTTTDNSILSNGDTDNNVDRLVVENTTATIDTTKDSTTDTTNNSTTDSVKDNTANTTTTIDSTADSVKDRTNTVDTTTGTNVTTKSTTDTDKTSSTDGTNQNLNQFSDTAQANVSAYDFNYLTTKSLDTGETSTSTVDNSVDNVDTTSDSDVVGNTVTVDNTTGNDKTNTDEVTDNTANETTNSVTDEVNNTIGNEIGNEQSDTDKDTTETTVNTTTTLNTSNESGLTVAVTTGTTSGDSNKVDTSTRNVDEQTNNTIDKDYVESVTLKRVTQNQHVFDLIKKQQTMLQEGYRIVINEYSKFFLQERE